MARRSRRIDSGMVAQASIMERKNRPACRLSHRLSTSPSLVNAKTELPERFLGFSPARRRCSPHAAHVSWDNSLRGKLLFVIDRAFTPVNWSSGARLPDYAAALTLS